MMIDNGQHVFLRCCTSYQDLLTRLGVTGQVAIQDRFDVTVLSGAPGARPARLRRNGLPSPLHLAGALAGYPLLSLAERARVGRAALAFWFADPASPALDRQRLGDWLAARGQDERARRRLWDLFIISALNIGGDDANVGLAATVIKTALLGRRDAADIGMAKVPLGRLHADATSALLARLGAEVRLGARAAAIESLAGGFRIALSRGDAGSDEPVSEGSAETAETDGQSILADGVVLAVPSGQAARLAGTAGVIAATAWEQLGCLADRERARDLRPPGHEAAVRRSGGFTGAVGIRQDQAIWPRGRAVPGCVAISRRRLRGYAHSSAAGAFRA